MKLKFHKDDDAEITVSQRIDGVDAEFSYVAMVKALYSKKKLEEAEIGDSFSDAEVESITRMIELLNEQMEQSDEGAD